MAPFSFQEGRKVFNGAITCNLSFLFSPTGDKSPKDVICKILTCTIECKEKNREKLKRRPQGDAEHDEAAKKSFLKEHSVSFLLKSHS
jgi:hypothetical protein